MKRFTTMFFAIIFMLVAATTFSQTVNTQVYTNYGYGIDSVLSTKGEFAKSESKFNIKDVFIGADYIYDANFSAGAKLRYNGSNEKLSLYTASINYATNVSKDLDLNLSLGQNESFWYSYTNGIWNNYAIDNVLSEKFQLVDRTQTGLRATLINKNITGSFEISNGINNKNKAFKFSAVVTPVENLKIGAFYNNYKADTLVGGFNANVFGGNAFYKLTTKKSGSFNLYGEYIQKDSIKTEAMTFYGEYFFNDSPFSLLARFDRLYVANVPQEQYITGGVNYSPNEQYKFGLNWRNFNNLKISQKHNEVYFTAGFNF